MPHSGRSVVHLAQGSFFDSGSRVFILGKVKTFVTPCSQSIALVLLQPPVLFCVLEGESLPGPFSIYLGTSGLWFV